MTVGFWEESAAAPDRVALVGPDGGTFTFAELRRWSDGLAVGLIERGVRPGDRVAVMLGNEPAFLAVQLATEQLGLDLVPVNRHLTEVEVLHVLADSAPVVVVAGSEYAATMVAAARAAGVPDGACFASDTGTDLPSLAELARPGAPDPARRLLGATMLYTSGTTGAPKGVRKARPAAVPEVVLRTRLTRSTQRYGWPPGPGVHLVVAPLHHAAPNGFAMSALHRGHTVVLMARWRPDEFLELVARHRVTSSHMVPTMFHRLLALPPEVRAAHDLSSLNFVVHAGAPCPVAEKRAMLDWLGPVVHEYYSSTEGGGTAVHPEEWLAHPGSVGRAWDGAEVRILDDEGMPVPTGTVGGVWLRNGDGFEYFRDPEKTAGAWRDGFFTAGDLGRLDADGYLYLADRRVDLILSGGVNIYPAEVEQALLTHPAVADAGVVGLPDADWGQRVHAVVELAAGYEPSEALGREILARAAEELARFKRPRSIAFGTLPRTDTGKLRRRLLPAL